MSLLLLLRNHQGAVAEAAVDTRSGAALFTYPKPRPRISASLEIRFATLATPRLVRRGEDEEISQFP